MENSKKKKISIQYLLLYFLIYAIIGWLLETAYAVGTLGHFVKRGFLYGPLCPIYGWGAVILISCLKKYKSKPLKLFLYSAIVFSVFEYVAGFALDALFSARWWDYTNDFLNLNGRISIFYSFAWGIIALVFIHFIHPFIEKIVKKVLKKIPNKVQLILINLSFIILVVDTILSSIKYLNMF
ncbi:MAG: putative ABC transporter permease [Clostridia bacterium]|nr:putative ABC transporter permease [Clostridia bacterium]